MEQLALFLKFFHTTMTEELIYNINMFNAASGGSIVLRTQRTSQVMQGGIETWSYFGNTPNLIRRRNPNGNEKLDLKNLANKFNNAIRIGWSTESLNLSKNVWDWLGRDPAQAGYQFGVMMARQMLEEYISRAFLILKATVGSNDNAVLDVSTQASADVYGISLTNLLYAADQLGDAAGNIRAWLMPTAAKTELLADNLKNQTNLYRIGNISVVSDVEGRTIITSDDPNLRDFDASNNIIWWAFGLQTDAIVIEDLNDWDEIYDQHGGYENIMRTYNANWSSKISVLGYKYDETQLSDYGDDKGKFASASDAALAAPENWTQVPPTHKQTAGIALRARSVRPAYAAPKMYNQTA